MSHFNNIDAAFSPLQVSGIYYLANSSTRFAIRRLSSGQRSFKHTRFFPLLVSERPFQKKRKCLQTVKMQEGISFLVRVSFKAFYFKYLVNPCAPPFNSSFSSYFIDETFAYLCRGEEGTRGCKGGVLCNLSCWVKHRHFFFGIGIGAVALFFPTLL